VFDLLNVRLLSDSRIIQVEQTLTDGLYETKFADTFMMSTYLMAWAILPDDFGRRADVEAKPFVCAIVKIDAVCMKQYL
jgi:hypothetical protein